MRKLTLLLTLIATNGIVLTINGQELYKCDTTKSFWTFTKDNSFFTVKLMGNAKETERKSVISFDSYVLQNVLVDKVKFIKEGEDNSDLTIMIRYALSEAEYFSGVFKKKVNIKMLQAPLSADKSVLIWFFEMPPGQNHEVKFQLFANIIVGDKIFGLASSQFADQKFDSVKDFLMDVISTLKQVESQNEFDKLCGQ
jgi:hypothetical protein